ncbi:MAG: hypothetical protein KKC20_10315 [Proteobacteria bacterium]|nr:hypothetical protein [Pseudomonadota bacterium]
MVDHGKEDESDESFNSEKRDFWFKLGAIGKAATAIVAALISVIGGYFLYTQREASNKIYLYTQLIGEQEKAENAVRKDMFTTILSSFLDKDKNFDTEGTHRIECVMDKIDSQLLELEMISRNFHETMDLRPLFIHVLLNIVRDIPREYKFTDEEIEDLQELSLCKSKALNRLLQTGELEKTIKKTKKKLINDHIDKLKNKKLNNLITIAQRITKKQLESLSDVEKRIRITIDLTKTCQDISPSQPLTENDICQKEGTEKGPIELILNDNEPVSNQCRRKFTISSNRSYRAWNQVRLKVITNKLDSEINADLDGGKDKTSEFWVGYFDFPLVDNTFLSTKERFAVLLDSINDNEAKVSLLYFPASYAGFKEKSYYQHRIINTLLNDSSGSN